MQIEEAIIRLPRLEDDTPFYSRRYRRLKSILSGGPQISIMISSDLYHSTVKYSDDAIELKRFMLSSTNADWVEEEDGEI